jgi:uncharacterized repeat protein (TIGR03803 family)
MNLTAKFIAAAAMVILPLPACPQTIEVLHSFTISPDDGVNPFAGLVQTSDGSFYGTTQLGGSVNEGTVYRLSSNVVTILHSFSCWGADQAQPDSGLIQGKDGYLYGTTYGSGSSIDYVGTVFRISTDGAFEDLYSFSTNPPDGEWPEASLLQAADGCLYGTASGGGSNGFGMVFRVTTNGNYSQVYSFCGGYDGCVPLGGLLRGVDGGLYGTTSQGGTTSWGTAFRLTTNGAHTLLHTFTGLTYPIIDGGYPVGNLIQAVDGNLYGMTSYGGSHFLGAVFRLSTNGNYATIYSFSGSDGSYPAAGLMQASDGYLYGTAQSGGTSNLGTIFRITTNGVLTTLHSFTGNSCGDGSYPQAGLVQGSDGNLYGTTETGGGFYDGGTIFRVTLPPPPIVIRVGVLSSGDGQLLLQATGLTEHGPVVLLASTNLTVWKPILTNAPASGSSTFGPLSIASQPRCFYLVRQN